MANEINTNYHKIKIPSNELYSINNQIVCFDISTGVGRKNLNVKHFGRKNEEAYLITGMGLFSTQIEQDLINENRFYKRKIRLNFLALSVPNHKNFVFPFFKT